MVGFPRKVDCPAIIKMKIVVFLHLFPPEHNAGSETTVHAAMRAMVNRGHQVQVICDRSATAPYEIDGISVIRPPRRGRQRWMVEFVRDCDLLITHLDVTSQAMQLALSADKPLAHFIHNSAQLEYWGVTSDQLIRLGKYTGERLKCQLAIFNSHWIAELPVKIAGIKETAQPWLGPQITIHPVVEPEYYRCERGESITLVNPTVGKGAMTFYALAQRFPERLFITAQGGYGYQVACPTSETRIAHRFYDETGSEQNCMGLPNVTHLHNDPDIRNVFRQTRVLLMPSDYESYGRVGVEAACAGIPTIAHPTPGLREAFGDAAIFCDREDIDSWAKEIERLYADDIYYRQRSDAALALVDSLTPESEFDRLEIAFLETVERWNRGKETSMAKVWISDRRFWLLRDGNYKAETNGRIPPDAVTLAYGIGSRVPEELAIQRGWIQGKAKQAPDENKAFAAPQENKSRKQVA